MAQKDKLVLASSSPRRRELLARGAWKFQIAPAEIDESSRPCEEPYEYVLHMAESKARAVAAQSSPDSLVVGADTIVVDQLVGSGQEVILGKPADQADAERMLRQLRGRKHKVYTALAVVRVRDGLVSTDLCATEVLMRHYSDKEIAAYISTGDPMDKAGAYAIQHDEFNPVQAFLGCYANVVGMPLCHLTRLLSKFGIQPEMDITRACQSSLNYECKVFQKITLQEP